MRIRDLRSVTYLRGYYGSVPEPIVGGVQTGAPPAPPLVETAPPKLDAGQIGLSFLDKLLTVGFSAGTSAIQAGTTGKSFWETWGGNIAPKPTPAATDQYLRQDSAGNPPVQVFPTTTVLLLGGLAALGVAGYFALKR